MKLINQSHRPGGALIGVPNQAPRPRSGSEPQAPKVKSAPPLDDSEKESDDLEQQSTFSEVNSGPSIEAKPLDRSEQANDTSSEPIKKPKARKTKSTKSKKSVSAKASEEVKSKGSPKKVQTHAETLENQTAASSSAKVEKQKSTDEPTTKSEVDSPSQTEHSSRPFTEDQSASANDLKISSDKVPFQARREGDGAAIKPPENPRRMRPLTQADEVKLKKAEEPQEEIEEPVAAPWLFRGIHWLFGPALSSFFLLGVCVFGLFVYSQVLSILSQLATLPIWAQWVGTGALGLLGAMGGWVILRFLSMYLKLRRNRQFSLKSLTDRSEMRRLRWKHIQKCKRHLSDYLTEHNYEAPDKRQELISAGLTEDQIRSLSFARKALLDQELRIESQGWVKRFYEEFQKRLDEAADQEIRRHATRVGVKTAVVPIPLIDAVVTIYHAFSLFRSLCSIYQVRLNGLGTLYLMGLAFFSAYLTGKLEEGAEDLTDAITENSSNVLAGFSRVITPKLAEGFGAALLINRLGKEAKKRLQPLSPR